MTSFLFQIAQDSLSSKNVKTDLKIETVIVGVRYTCVLLSNGSCGVAYTLVENEGMKESHHKYLTEKYLHRKDIIELIEYCDSEFSIFRSIGIATLNAFSQANLKVESEEDIGITDILPEKASNVGMIGDIQPITRILVQKGYKVHILDKYPSSGKNPNIVNVNNISDLKNSTHLIVSGSAFVFNNFDYVRDLLSTVPGEKVLLGPTAQILPKIAFKHGFTYIGSSKIIDPSSTIRVIMEAGGYRAFKEFTKKYSFRAD